MRVLNAVSRAASRWRVWLPVVGWVIGAVVATQWLLHETIMGLSMSIYHVTAGLVQTILILVPAALYIFWRRTAQRERVALENLRRSERLRDDLTAMLVHDLRNPVISTAMALDCVLENAKESECLPPVDREMMVRARRNLRRLEGMIGDMLSINAAQAGRMKLDREPTDLCALAVEIVADYGPRADGKGIDLSADDSCSAPTIRIDREHINRVIDNLLSNAIDHTSSGGAIGLTVVEGEEDVVVSVADTGDGIDEALSHELFDRYAQKRSAGGLRRSSVGLGLAYCKMAVEAHGGRIWAENTDDGSRFSFSLPIV